MNQIGGREFLGRDAELATFERAVADARAGVPSVLLVDGDAGIGKSSLVAEAARRANVALILGRSAHIGGDVIPLAPLMDLLRQVQRSMPETLADRAESMSLAQWLTPGTGQGVPAVSEVFVPVLDLVGRLASDDAVMIGVEDLHWADASTWDLFELLARNLFDEHVVLVGTFRAIETGANPVQRRRLAEFTRLPAVHRIHLEGLGRDEVSARIATMIAGPLPAGLVDQILARGQGNPFYTDELVGAHLAGEVLPAVLSDLISTDLAGLDHHSRDVLGVVAAIGRESSHELLVTVSGLDDETVESGIRAAIEAQLIVVDEGSEAYRFRHALIGEVVYAELLPSERKRLHRRVADAIAARAATSSVDVIGELAFHLDRAGDHARAFLALLTAADAAETVAPAVAVRQLDRALALWDEVGDTAAGMNRAHRMWQAAELASGTVGYARAFELARVAFTYGPPPLGAAWGHERLGRYLWATGDLAGSALEYERAATLLESGDDHPGAAATFAGLAQSELMFGRFSSAEQWCSRVFEVVRSRDDDPFAWVMATRVLGIVRATQDAVDEGLALSRHAVDAAPTAQTRALATIYLGQALLDAGAYPEAVAVTLDGVADGQLTGLDTSFGGYLDALAAEALIRLGRWADADVVLARHDRVEAFNAANLRLCRARAMGAARRGHIDAARGFLAEAFTRPVDSFHQLFLDAVSAEVHLIAGDWQQAALAAERGWEASVDVGRLWSARFAMFSICAAVEQTLDDQARRQAVDEAAVSSRLADRLDRIGSPTERAADSLSPDAAAHLAHATAMLTRLTGPDPDAWAAAAIAWQELGDPWATATARLREADAAASTGRADRATEALRDANRIAVELGAASLVDEISAVSRRTRISLHAPDPVRLDDTSVDQLGLTPREAEVLGLVATGHTNRQIGETLYVSEKTASVHVSNILRKLAVTSRVDAAAVAQRLGVA
jgi:DNA-binding CsgD family transcriptional regulator/tetratricopeptide (TPR) repeat protein